MSPENKTSNGTPGVLVPIPTLLFAASTLNVVVSTVKSDDNVTDPVNVPVVPRIAAAWKSASAKLACDVSMCCAKSGSGVYPLNTFQRPSVASRKKPACA